MVVVDRHHHTTATKKTQYVFLLLSACFLFLAICSYSENSTWSNVKDFFVAFLALFAAYRHFDVRSHIIFLDNRDIKGSLLIEGSGKYLCVIDVAKSGDVIFQATDWSVEKLVFKHVSRGDSLDLNSVDVECSDDSLRIYINAAEAGREGVVYVVGELEVYVHVIYNHSRGRILFDRTLSVFIDQVLDLERG